MPFSRKVNCPLFPPKIIVYTLPGNSIRNGRATPSLQQIKRKKGVNSFIMADLLIFAICLNKKCYPFYCLLQLYDKQHCQKLSLMVLPSGKYIIGLIICQMLRPYPILFYTDFISHKEMFPDF